MSSYPWLRQLWRVIPLASVGLGLSFVLSAGPLVQTYLLSLLNSDAPSIYGSAFHQNLVEFPSLGTWVANAFDWKYLSMGVALAWVSLRKAKPRAIAWNTACAAFLVLSIFDIGFGLHSGLISGKWVAENFASNFFGGAILGALVVGFFSAADFAYKHLPVDATPLRYIALVVVSLTGFIYCCTAYYLSELFYDPLPTHLDVSFSPPSSGAFTVHAPASGPTSQIDRPFSLVPDARIEADALWISPPGNINVKTLLNSKEPFRVAITPLTGCTSIEAIKKLKGRIRPWLTSSGVTHFEILGDKGPSDFMTTLSDRNARIGVHTGSTTSFNVNQEPESKRLKITHFVGDDSSIDMHSDTEMSFFLGIPLMSTDEKRLSLAARAITIRLGTQKRIVRFSPPKNMPKGSEKLVCTVLKDLPPISDDPTAELLIQQAPPVAGVLVQISHRVDSESMSTEDVGIRVTSPGGWIELVGLKGEQLNNQELGRLEMLQIHGNISDLSLDEVTQTTRQIETYTAMGDLKAKYGVDGKLRVWGQAKRMWKDEARLNATKWEGLGWEPKLFILGLIGAVLSAISTAVAKRLHANSAFAWMP